MFGAICLGKYRLLGAGLGNNAYCERLSTGASSEAPVDNDCFGVWACPDPLAIGSWAGQV